MKLRRDIVTFLHVAAQRYLKKYYKFLLRNVFLHEFISLRVLQYF